MLFLIWSLVHNITLKFIYCFVSRTNTWALCPSGFYLEGIYISDSSPKLYHIEEAKCCHPQNHPDSYDGCYDEDVTISFDHKGWSQCKQDGYYMAGFYKSSCNELYCIEKFRCCKMKKGNWFLHGVWISRKMMELSRNHPGLFQHCYRRST